MLDIAVLPVQSNKLFTVHWVVQGQKRFRVQGKVCVECIPTVTKEKDLVFKCGSTGVLPGVGALEGSLSLSLFITLTPCSAVTCAPSRERQSTQEALRPAWPADET